MIDCRNRSKGEIFLLECDEESIVLIGNWNMGTAKQSFETLDLVPQIAGACLMKVVLRPKRLQLISMTV